MILSALTASSSAFALTCTGTDKMGGQIVLTATELGQGQIANLSMIGGNFDPNDRGRACTFVKSDGVILCTVNYDFTAVVVNFGTSIGRSAKFSLVSTPSYPGGGGEITAQLTCVN